MSNYNTLTITTGPKDRKLEMKMTCVDHEGEMEISIERFTVNSIWINKEAASIWINKEAAESIIEHLKRQFEL